MTCRSLLVSWMVVATALLVTMEAACAETWDLARLSTVLIGKWEGDLRVARDPDRTLIIKSVRSTGTGFAAEADYGITGRAMRPVDIAIEVGDFVTLKFMTPARFPATLTLMQGKYMVGILRGSQVEDIPMKLERMGATGQ